MKLLILIFFMSGAFANDFELSETSVRFKLSIKPASLSYKSELIQKDLVLNDCKKKFAAELNDQLLSNLPDKEASKGLVFKIDDQKIFLDPQSKFARLVMKMDATMTSFFMRQSKLCP